MTALDADVVSFPPRPFNSRVELRYPLNTRLAGPGVLEKKTICYPRRESNCSLSERQLSSTLKTHSIYFSEQVPTFCKSAYITSQTAVGRLTATAISINSHRGEKRMQNGTCKNKRRTTEASAMICQFLSFHSGYCCVNSSHIGRLPAGHVV
jgi:hypothetical protein